MPSHSHLLDSDPLNDLSFPSLSLGKEKSGMIEAAEIERKEKSEGNGPEDEKLDATATAKK